MSMIAYFFWGILVVLVLFGVLFDKVFPNKVEFTDQEHNKSANQQLSQNMAMNNKNTNEITSTFIP